MLVVLLILWVAAAVLLRATEGRSNAEFASMPKVLWNISVYFFSGLDSAQPVTSVGRVVVALVLVLSVGVVATFTGSIASFLVESRMGSRRKMPNYNLNNHIVICNWNDKAIPIIRELHAAILKDKRPIVVVSEQTDAGDLPDKEDDLAFEDVFLIKGDPANEIILKRAGVQDSYSVLILADPQEGRLADAKSILISMAARSLCLEADAAKLHICVEGIDPRNVDHLKRGGAEEVVAASDFTTMLLAQSALLHGLSTVYHNLLEISGDTNEIYILPVPDAFLGKGFAELGAAIFRNRDPANPSILIGVRTKDGIFVNPRGHEMTAFAKDDEVIIIAFEKPERLI
jgi:voltage-gated potassium channel